MKAKKLLSVIIAGLMILSMTAFTASAEEEVIDETEVAVEETAAEEEAPAEEEAETDEESDEADAQADLAEEEYVAQVGEDKYTTLKDAITNAPDGGEVLILTDIADMGTLGVGKNLTINGGGNKITGKSNFYMDSSDKDITIKNIVFENIHNETVVDDSTCDYYGIVGGKVGSLTAITSSSLSGTLTIEGCTFDTVDWDAIQITPNKNSVINITGNTFKHTDNTVSQLRYIHIEGTIHGFVGTACSVTVNDNIFLDNDNVPKSDTNSAPDIGSMGIYYVAASGFDLTHNYYYNVDTVSLYDGTFTANRHEYIYPAKRTPEDTEYTLSPVAYNTDIASEDINEVIASANAKTSNTYVYLLKDVELTAPIVINNAAGAKITIYAYDYSITGDCTLFDVSTNFYIGYNSSKMGGGSLVCTADDGYIADVKGGTAEFNIGNNVGAFNGTPSLVGGTYDRDVEQYVKTNKYYLKDNGDGTYTVANLNDELALEKGFVAKSSTSATNAVYYSNLTSGFGEKTSMYLLKDITENITATEKTESNYIYAQGYSFNGSFVGPNKTLWIYKTKTATANLTNVEVKTLYVGESSNACTVVINDGNISDTIKVRGKSVLTIKNGTFNKIVPDSGATLIISGGKFNGTIENKGTITITGGTFAEDVSAYVADGYFQKTNEDGTYTVSKVEAKVIDTASTTGAVVTLDNLESNDAIELDTDATIKVVVESAPADDVAKANAAIESNEEDTNDSKAIFDISVVKVDSNGTETDLGGNGEGSVQNQKVTITLGETPVENTVKAYHVDDNGAVAKINGVSVEGRKVSFIAPSFSTYAFTYTAVPLADDSATKNIGVAFERVADTSEYNIVLKSLDAGKVINRFMSTDLTFKLDVTSGAVDYIITPAANVNLVDNNNGRYEFNIDGLVLSGVTAEEITIGSVIFDGYGAIKFSVDGTAITNEVNTAKVGTNIVDTFTPNGDGVTTGDLKIGDEVTNGTIDVTFKAPTKNLTINVAYNNKIENQKADYQAMTITVNGGDLTSPIVKKLGSDNTAEVTYDSANSVYTVEIADTLTQNTAYTVVVEGQGYRTARYTVTMNANKTLNFWNDVKVSEEQVEEGNDASKSFVNFLAGEIVKDGQINLYDLSAVVSYFGTLNNVEAESAFAKYDLNRDGKIDSRDVAYVLVSWGK